MASAVLFDDRVRFNWGYHDAAQAVREGWDSPERNYGFGSFLVLRTPQHVLERHPSPIYAAGWMAGYADAKAGRNTTSSDPAWEAHNAPGAGRAA